MELFRRGCDSGVLGGGREVSGAWCCSVACTSAHFTRRTKVANCLLLTARPLHSSDVLRAADVTYRIVNDSKFLYLLMKVLKETRNWH